jgi:hypothetical protein
MTACPEGMFLFVKSGLVIPTLFCLHLESNSAVLYCLLKVLIEVHTILIDLMFRVSQFDWDEIGFWFESDKYDRKKTDIKMKVET